MECVWKTNLRNWGRLEDTNVKQLLKECNKPAKTGHKIAVAQEKSLNRVLALAWEFY